MRLRKARPVKHTNKQVIDAIYETVMSACARRRPGGDFSVEVADLPEDAKGFDSYQLDRVALRLDIRGIKVRDMSTNSDTFYFYKP